MFKKFRRSSKDKTEQRKLSTTSTVAPCSLATTNSKDQKTFFSLPAELRNEIYSLVATTTALHLFNPNLKSLKQKATPGLLLATRQTRFEYLPILLSTAPIVATITDFDFSPLISLTGSLYATELKALRNNPHLRISLRTKKCSNDAYANLRRWCVNRASNLDRLPWSYRLDAGCGEEQLRWFAERARVLSERLGEEVSVRAEVQRVLEVLVEGLEGKGLGMSSGGFGDAFVTVEATRRRRTESALWAG